MSSAIVTLGKPGSLGRCWRNPRPRSRSWAFAILAARTGTELVSQLADLPNLGSPAALLPRHPPARPVSNLAPRLILAVLVVAVVAVVLILSAGHTHGVHTWNAAVPVLIGIFALRRLAGRR